MAYSLFRGTLSHDYQEKEALYKPYLRQVEMQEQRGWSIRKGWLHPPSGCRPVIVAVPVGDRDGHPFHIADLSGLVLRAPNSRDDFAFAIDELAAGEYRPTMTLPVQGRRDLVVQIRRDGDLHEICASTAVANSPADAVQ